MIMLLWSMLIARRGQAALLVLLSVFATAAAVAGPVYLGAVDRATVVNEVAESAPTERTVRLGSMGQSDNGSGARFDNLISSVLTLPGFTRVLSIRFGVIGVEPHNESPSWLTFREDVCAHLEIVAGRCLMSANDVLVGESTARRRGLGAGGTITVSTTMYNEASRQFVADGPPVTLTIAGIYRPLDADELYWTRTAAFLPGTPDTSREPLFVTRPGAEAHDPSHHERAVDAIPGPGSFTVERLPALRDEFSDLRQDLGRGSGAQAYVAMQTDLPVLLDRIGAAREPAGRLVPLAAVPLVALCWFVIFLAVAFGTAARRHELALLALRGGRWPIRWWFASGESTAAILVGAPIGFLAGLVGVGVAARVRFETAEAVDVGALWAAGAGAWWAALAAVGGAVLAGALAQRREVASPVVDLLRRVPARQARWRSLAVEATTVAVAVLATVQLRGFGGELVGLSLLVPGLVALAVALVCARLLMPLAGRFGARALRRGRLAPALGLLQLARRPGGQRLFVLMTVALAAVCFAASAVNVTGRARADRAEAQAGAHRTLTVSPLEAAALLRAVRAVDPDGSYAMAVGRLPATGAGRPPTLLVDSAALPQVPIWQPQFGLGAAETAGRLRPAAGAPFVLRGERAEVTVRAPAQPSRTPIELILVLRSQTDGLLLRTAPVILKTGEHRYVAETARCVDGCRVVGIEGRSFRLDASANELLISELRSGPAGPVVIGPADFAGRWRDVRDAQPRPGGPGFSFTVKSPTPPGAAVAVPVDSPAPLPVIMAGAAPSGSANMSGLDAELRPVSLVGSADALPGLGGKGMLADLEYVQRQSVAGTRLPAAEVWLSSDAPAGVTDLLREQGLMIIGDTTLAGELARLDRQAPALAVWFHLLAGGFAVLLALSGLALLAAVDRRRTEDVQVLRRQGLSGRIARRAGRWTYQPVVAAALVSGPLAAGAAWWAVGRYLPVVVDNTFRTSAPSWPEPAAVLGPWGLVALAFVAAALGLGWAARVRD